MKRLPAQRAAESAAWLESRWEQDALPNRIGWFTFDDAKSPFANDADPAKPGKGHDDPQSVSGRDGRAIALDGENSVTFPGVGDFTRATPFTLTLRLSTGKPTPRTVVLHHSKAPIDAGSRGYDLLLEENRVAFGLYHFWPGDALKVRTKRTIAPETWTDVAVTCDGSGRAAGVTIYLDGVAVETETLADSLTKDIVYGGGEPPLTIGQRFRDVGFKGGKVDELGVFDRALSAYEIGRLIDPRTTRDVWNRETTRLSPTERAALAEFYFAAIDDETQAARAALKTLRDERRKLIDQIPEAMAMRELPEAKPAFILKRGAYDAHGARVAADVPAVLPPLPADAPRNRLGLAQWLLRPEQPLFARVTVNRAWQMLFGRGLVESADNFGAQGDRPSHPELLDRLAIDFAAEDGT
ncbi:MAG: DUF1553 domain-containing protein [Pirellulales bacterium]